MGASANNPETQNEDLRETSLLRRYFVLLVCVGVGALIGLAISVGPSYVRAYSVLVHFADSTASGPLLRFETHAVTTEEVTIPTPSGQVRARLYRPVGVVHPSGMVAVHGMHRLGMDEPRLMSFARAVAGTGLAVLTPQIDALADYHVDASSIDDIGESAIWLAARLNTDQVTVTGISFAGGLSLLAASQTFYGSRMRALVLIGAYDDLPRVSRFLATGVQELPDGTSEPHAAHDYGASVFVYAHLNQFFPAADLDAAHEALRDWLWEQADKAKIAMERLSPPARATMDALLNRRIDEVRLRILSAIQTDQPELEAISPSGKLASLRVPVFVLHGSADNIIPPAESLWIAKDIPQGDLRALLITTAFSHVDPEKHAPWMAELRLVRFVAGVLRAAN
jgi:pimeloyl-ACP methyl ester carboxylesterase